MIHAQARVHVRGAGMRRLDDEGILTTSQIHTESLQVAVADAAGEELAADHRVLAHAEAGDQAPLEQSLQRCLAVLVVDIQRVHLV